MDQAGRSASRLVVACQTQSALLCGAVFFYCSGAGTPPPALWIDQRAIERAFPRFCEVILPRRAEHARKELLESRYRPVDDLLGFDVADDIERGIAAMWSFGGAAQAGNLSV